MITGMARGATGSTLVNSSVRAVGELAVVDPPVRAIVIAGRRGSCRSLQADVALEELGAEAQDAPSII